MRWKFAWISLLHIINKNSESIIVSGELVTTEQHQQHSSVKSQLSINIGFTIRYFPASFCTRRDRQRGWWRRNHSCEPLCSYSIRADRTRVVYHLSIGSRWNSTRWRREVGTKANTIHWWIVSYVKSRMCPLVQNDFFYFGDYTYFFLQSRNILGNHIEY